MSENTECKPAITQEQQQAMTPEEAVTKLMEGNARYVAGKSDISPECYPKLREETAGGQYPFAAVLCCVDSRLPAEIVFDQAIGDMFVARVAGNFVNEDIAGSLEFAVASGVKTIVVLGHTHCGAVKGACDGSVGLHALDKMLDNLRPAVDAAISTTGKVATSKDPQFVQTVADNNVRMTIAKLKAMSPLISDRANRVQDDKKPFDTERIKIIGGMYHLDSGKVEFGK